MVGACARSPLPAPVLARFRSLSAASTIFWPPAGARRHVADVFIAFINTAMVAGLLPVVVLLLPPRNGGALFSVMRSLAAADRVTFTAMRNCRAQR